MSVWNALKQNFLNEIKNSIDKRTDRQPVCPVGLKQNYPLGVSVFSFEILHPKNLSLYFFRNITL